MINHNKISRQQQIGLWLVIGILFIDMLLYSLVIPIIPLFIEKMNPSSTLIGVLFSSYAVALLLATPFFGSLSDRIGRKLPILFGLAGLAVSTVLFTCADSILTLIAARFMQGVAAAAAWSAALALLADLFPAQTRGMMMGIALTAISTGSLLGAPLGGWLLEVGGYTMPFFATTALTILVLLLVMLLLREPARTKGEQIGLFTLLRNRSVLFIAGIVLAAESLMTMLEPMLPVFFTERLAISPLKIGLLFGAMTLAYGLIAPFAGSLSARVNPRWIMLSGLGSLAVTLPLLLLSQTLWQEAGAMVLIGAGIGFTLSPTLSTLGTIVDRGGNDAYGTAYALFNMFHAVGMIAGPLIGGVLTDLLSIPTAIGSISAALLIGVLVAFLLEQRQEKAEKSKVA